MAKNNEAHDGVREVFDALGEVTAGIVRYPAEVLATAIDPVVELGRAAAEKAIGIAAGPLEPAPTTGSFVELSELAQPDFPLDD